MKVKRDIKVIFEDKIFCMKYYRTKEITMYNGVRFKKNNLLR